MADVPGDSYVVVEAYTKDTAATMEYLLKVNFFDTPSSHKQNPYLPANGGQLTYKYLRGRKGNVLLSWSPLYSALDSTPVTNVRYKLVFSTDPDAVLDSVCALRATDSDIYTVYEDVDGDNEHVIELT